MNKGFIYTCPGGILSAGQEAAGGGGGTAAQLTATEVYGRSFVPGLRDASQSALPQAEGPRCIAPACLRALPQWTPHAKW